MKTIAIVVVVTVTFLSSCNQKKASSIGENKVVQDTAYSNIDNEVYVMMKNQCFICHNAGTGRNNMIAPPMIRVKEHYMDDDISRADFIANISSWVTDPTEDKIQMPGAVDKFNIMPKMVFSVADIEAIAAYMYDNELEGPSWWGAGKKNQDQGRAHEDGSDEMGHGWKKRMTLDNGQLWKANSETTSGVKKMSTIIASSLALETLSQKEVSMKLNAVKNDILQECTMKGESHDMLHVYLVSLGEKIDKLPNIEKERMARIILKKIDKQLNEYADYFM